MHKLSAVHVTTKDESHEVLSPSMCTFRFNFDIRISCFERAFMIFPDVYLDE